MAYMRQNVWELGKSWADPLLWYAKAVREMQKLPLNDKLSWRFYAAIHGFHPGLWTAVGYLSAGDKLPTSDIQKRYWLQCQHGSWYFLPWHRGYLFAFEENIRAIVSQLGGPTDWTLPYWDYFKAGQNSLPAEFAAKTLPDNSPNPLFVPQRYGPYNDGRIFVVTTGDDATNLNAMTERDFTGVQGAVSRGFGGLDTGFEHDGSDHGQFESDPHDAVHGMVGGGTRARPGLMSFPQSAGLDPIFWLHHANIDRLWEVWRRSSAAHADPPEARWQDGPPEPFVMPMSDGSEWRFTPGQMSKFSDLNYSYTDLSPIATRPILAERLQRLGITVAQLPQDKELSAMKINVELLGANRNAVKVSGAEAHTEVELHPTVRKKVASSLETASLLLSDTVPDRVFLNLENVRGTEDATRLKVYVSGNDDSDSQPVLAGAVSLFGVHQASQEDSEHGGRGLNLGLEITHVVDQLHLAQGLDVNKLNVTLVPVVPVPEEHPITIDRISISRQGK